MSDKPSRIYEAFLSFRRIFTALGQTNPRYFQVFLHREIGPRYVSIPKIFLCALGIGIVAPLVRLFFPVVTFLPLYLLPFAPRTFFPWYRDGNFTAQTSEILPFILFAIAFLITAIRRHLDGQRRIIEGEPLHTYDRGTPRLFKPTAAVITIKEPLLIFALGAVYSYAALFTFSFHPAFGAFLMVGALDLWLSEALLSRYFTVTVRDELDQEIRAAHLQQMREEALSGKRGQLGRPSGVAAQEAADFHHASPGKRS